MQKTYHKNQIPSIWRTHSCRILIIEDEPIWQAIISQNVKLVSGDQTQLRFVRNARQALDLLYHYPDFDLILADQRIEGEISGLEFWSICKSKFPQIPFIMVSGMRLDYFNRLQNKGVNLPYLINKPFDEKHFRKVLKIYLESKVQ